MVSLSCSFFSGQLEIEIMASLASARKTRMSQYLETQPLFEHN